ncbi:Molybdopterin converting factor, small subunit [Thermanaeromonas toyohensis ToBE]|uniref:Molybdopterin converting factor, small subunit n=1 Tax=Thermanaeromonas toyohensis ToBE TaxID=698762 RepID=A0A1W1VYC2_9FIRM|nr:MoaD/ThiS family protein [Thermanaeromonas toyohensis]SMB98367.1 Molybdopterin converting factor, small subunit [Thermanaeromonas toyohensis ToBE]
MSINIKVRLYATLNKYNPTGPNTQEFALKIEPGTSLFKVYEILGIPPEEIKQAFVNGRRVEPEYILKDNDEIGIFPPIAGG